MSYTPPISPFIANFNAFEQQSSPFVADFLGTTTSTSSPEHLSFELSFWVPLLPVNEPLHTSFVYVTNIPKQKTLKPLHSVFEAFFNKPRSSSFKPQHTSFIVSYGLSSRRREPIPAIFILQGYSPRPKTSKPLHLSFLYRMGTPLVTASAVIFINEPLPIIIANTEIFVSSKSISRAIWRLVLSDDVVEVTVPMANFSETLNSQKNSYRISVPNGKKWLQKIVGKTKFKIVSVEEYVDSRYSETVTEWIDIETVTPNQGGTNYSVAILGSVNRPESIAKTMKVEKLQYNSVTAQGQKLIRVRNNMQLVQGDTVILPDTSKIVVGVLTRNISTSQKVMQLREV